MLICGCGPSLNELAAKPDCITVGVNDVGRRFDPDYLVVVNSRSQFPPDRFRAIVESRARAVFSQYADIQPKYATRVHVALGTYGGTNFDNPNVLHFTQNSPYVALCLAIHMGAARIGLIGVDFTNDHFFGATGIHPLAGRLRQIEGEYARVRDACRARGIEVFNLSPTSRLNAFPRQRLAEFIESAAGGTQLSRKLRIVSYATTPVAGVPSILARCITARTPHQARCVWSTNDYGNGVRFDGDLEWSDRARTGEAEAAIAAADVVIVHNGKVEERHRGLLMGKPVVTLAHNYAWNVDMRYVEQGMPGVVVGQYQATLPEFATWTAVPNPVPSWEIAFSPEKKGDVVTVAYTPSGRHETYPTTHRLYWHSKGYDTTMRVLDALTRRHRIEVIAVREKHLSHADALAAKRRAHIVIDECVTGSYHRNSLEGLSCGALVVNGVGSLPAVTTVLRHCSGGATDVPFHQANLGSIESVLDGLIEAGPTALAEAGCRNRRWFEEHWNFKSQWPEFWLPVIERAANAGLRTGDQRMHRVGAEFVPVARQEPPVTIVIPHRGADRTRLLRKTLQTLRSHLPKVQIIVTELAARPVAVEAVRAVRAIHVRLPSDSAFERARALNVGSAIAGHELIVWHDNDLIAGPRFFAAAAAEMLRQDLDFLIPYSCIHYLSESDTDAVLRGDKAARDCRPTRTLVAGRDASGGMGIVNRRFLDRFGGFSHEFVGWGGEDNFWWKKVTLLGRAGVTQDTGQVLWHLFHATSGALMGRPPVDTATYRRNVAILAEAAKLKTAPLFTARFPCPPGERCPFPSNIVLRFVVDSDCHHLDWARRTASILDRQYGLRPFLTEPGNTCDGDPPFAWVIFGTGSLKRWQPVDSRANDTILMVLAADIGTSLPELRAYEFCAIVTDATPAEVAATGLGAPVWSWEKSIGSAVDPQFSTAPLVAALSQLTAAPLTTTTPIAADPSNRQVPVWLYWEGSKPAWIEQCHATIRAHAPSANILSPADFDVLRDRDRDIDIRHLVPAHRADYIRAFLLWRHGGIWLDSDCLLMRPLDEIHALLHDHDFIAHRDRQGYFPNGFIAAAPSSVIAAAFYERVAAVVRTRRPPGWIALGGEPLTRILTASRANWHVLPCEQIQPICWSDPQAFFAVADATTHMRKFQPRALTYMLSNSEVQKYQRSNKGHDLLADGTFFRFLLARSLECDPLAGRDRDPMTLNPRLVTFAGYHRAGTLRGDESISGPGSTVAQTATIARALPRLLRSLGVQTLLDAGCGDLNWIGRIELGTERYIGVDIVPELIERNRRRFGDSRREFHCLDVAHAELPRADAVLCRDTLVHYSLDGARTVLRNIQRGGATHIIMTTFPNHGKNEDIPLGGWRPLNMQASPFRLPAPLDLIVENCTEMGGRYADKSLGLWPLQELDLKTNGCV